MYCSYVDNTVPTCLPIGPMATVTAIMRAAAIIEERAEEVLGGINMSLAKQKALRRLVTAGEALSLSDMAQQLTCVRSNMTQLVDRLEADGLVRRVDDPSDRRIVRAEITPLGRERAGQGDQLLDSVQKELMVKISARDDASLVRILAMIG